MYLGIIICSIISLVLVILGYLIWAKKKLFLIAGYNEETFEGNKEKLARITGGFTIFSGLLMFVLPFLLAVFSDIMVFIIFFFVIFIGVFTLIIFLNMSN